MRDSLDILSQASGRRDLSNDPSAVELAKQLDGLPLALATAGAYLRQSAAVSFEKYLRFYETSWAQLQKDSPNVTTYWVRTLYSIWQISFDQIKEQNYIAANLLQLWAYFDNQDLWFELLHHATDEEPEWFCKLTKDELAFTSVIRVLCDHGIVDADPAMDKSIEAKGYSVHSLVHSWTKTVLNPEWDHILSTIAVTCIGQHAPEQINVNKWQLQQRMLNHALKTLPVAKHDADAGIPLVHAFHKIGLLLSDQSQFNEADTMLHQALRGYKAMPDHQHHPRYPRALNSVGIVYRQQGRLDESEAMLQRALQGKEKTLGNDHIETLDTVNDLAILYELQGRLDESEAMLQRALQGYEKTLGKDHTETLGTINKMGNLYEVQGKLDEAETMFERALQGYEETIGENHDSTLDTVNNIGFLYKKQRKLDEAETMLQRALRGKEAILGPSNISTIATVYNLGLLYRDQRRSDKAEDSLRRALAGYQRVYGDDHAKTRGASLELGFLFIEQYRLHEAQSAYQQALLGYDRMEPNLQAALNDVGYRLHQKQRSVERPEALLRRVLAALDTTISSRNWDFTLSVGVRLGYEFVQESKFEMAQMAYERVLLEYDKMVPNKQARVNWIGYKLHRERHGVEQSEHLLQRVLAALETTDGQDWHRMLFAGVALVYELIQESKFEMAQMAYERVLPEYNKMDSHHQVWVNWIGSRLHQERRGFEQPEHLLQKVLAALETTDGQYWVSTVYVTVDLGYAFLEESKLLVAQKVYERVMQEYKKANPALRSLIDELGERLRADDSAPQETTSVDAQQSEEASATEALTSASNAPQKAMPTESRASADDPGRSLRLEGAALRLPLGLYMSMHDRLARTILHTGPATTILHHVGHRAQRGGDVASID